jgi:hypothetical protein
MSNADRENDPELKFLKKHAAISSLVTSDIIPDNKYRAQRIDSLARGSVPLHYIAKVAVRKARRMNSYVVRVNYGSGSNSINNRVDEDGLTQLEIDLAILNWEI